MTCASWHRKQTTGSHDTDESAVQCSSLILQLLLLLLLLLRLLTDVT